MMLFLTKYGPTVTEKSVSKNACFVAYFKENLMLIIFQIKIAWKSKDFWDHYNLGQKVGEKFTKLGKMFFYGIF